MISIELITEIVRLHSLTDWSFRQIAQYLHVSHQSVSRYVKRVLRLDITWQQLNDKSANEIYNLLKIDTDSTSSSKKIHLDYEEESRLLLSRRKGNNKASSIINQHLAKFGERSVGKSTLYKGLRDARKTLSLSMTQTFVPGRALHIDYAGVSLKLNNGLVLYFFVAVWAYSKRIFFRATSNQKQSSWFTCIDISIRENGVKPIFVVSDNASPLVKIKNGERTITDGYQQLINHHDFVADFIPPGRPNYNQPAEQGVKIFTEEVFPKLLQLALIGEEDTNEVLIGFANDINSRVLKGRDNSRQTEFDTEEKTVCQPCNANVFEPITSHRQVSIGKHYRFQHDGVYYSVPKECYYKKVSLEIHIKRIEVKLGKKLVYVHERKPKGSKHVILAEHMPDKHRVLVEQNKHYFVRWAMEKDECIARMISAQYDEKALCDTDFYARKQCLEIQKLYQRYELKGLSGEFVTTCFICVESGKANVTTLRAMLNDEVYENDELINAFEVFYASKQVCSEGVRHHVH
jgi:predicted DNA-binding protein YlxM (UPF0122 family)